MKTTSEIVEEAVRKAALVVSARAKLAKAGIDLDAMVKKALAAEKAGTPVSTNKLDPPAKPPGFMDAQAAATASQLTQSKSEGSIGKATAAALKNQRTRTGIQREVSVEIAEAAADHRPVKTRPVTRDEIEACTQKNASGAESVLGVIRAQRLIIEGKLPK